MTAVIFYQQVQKSSGIGKRRLTAPEINDVVLGYISKPPVTAITNLIAIAFLWWQVGLAVYSVSVKSDGRSGVPRASLNNR